jgi:hypothetical protein
MARLDGVMVDPARKAASSTAEAMRGMAGEVHDLLGRLFPEVQQLLDYRKDLATLDKAGLPAGQADEARRRLSLGLAGYSANDNVDVRAAQDSKPLIDDKAISDSLDALGPKLTGFADKAKVTTVAVAKSFKDMADATLQSLDRLAGAIKGGGFLDILGAVIGLGLQLGSIGAFGKTIQTNINKPKVPGYAGGTSFHPGGLAMVGERGPELVNLPRGSRVWPNGDGPGRGGGGSTVRVIPSPYFDVVVDGRIVRASPAIMGGGAQVAQSQMARRQTRRVA